MREAFTATEIASYRERGFLVVADLLDTDDLQRWRDAVLGALSERTTRLPGEDDFDRPDGLAAMETERRRWAEYYQTVFTQRLNLWKSHPGVRSLIFDSPIGQLARQLMGVGRVRLWQDQALVKEPYAPPTSFHLDEPYWSFECPDALSLWVALDDATVENGCLFYVPGSHAVGVVNEVEIGRDLGAIFTAYPDWRDVAPVATPVAAGGAVFHNGRTFHGAAANMTPRPRHAMTCAFMPDGATYNGRASVLPPEYVAARNVGDRLDDEEVTPLLR